MMILSKALNVGYNCYQILLSVICLCLFLLGGLNLFFSDKDEQCAMTYMFEYPQFVRITIPQNDLYPQYGLYSYSEGRFTERARTMWFNGVPVLFLPGNSGSHMQARSLASVALRMALSSDRDFHFDFFTVSFNEDISGLYGGFLQKETAFAAECVHEILKLYKVSNHGKPTPTSVILIGHSMGGLVAKRLLVDKKTQQTTSIAITLAAPLQAPVVNFDYYMNAFYKELKEDWRLMPQEVKNNKVLISFGNGPRDILMPPGLTASNYSDLSALTTSVPGVWVSPDHVGIVWCKQLVMSITRFMFSIVDPTTQQLKKDKAAILSKARSYFKVNRSMYIDANTTRTSVPMMYDAFWYEDNRRIYQITRPEINKTTYLMIRLASFPQNRFVAIEAVNVEDKDWLFGCNAIHTTGSYRYCKQGTSVSELSRWSFADQESGKRKVAAVHLHDIKAKYPEWSHVVVKVSPTRKPITLNVDINDHASRQIHYKLPSGISFSKRTIIQATESGSVYYELLLQGLEEVYQAYLLYVEPTGGCKAAKYHVTADLHIPWADNHDSYHYFTPTKRAPMKLRLFKTKLNKDPTQNAKVTLILDPQCTYTISIATSWYDGLGQVARHYGVFVISLLAPIIVLGVRENIVNLQRGENCVSFHRALMSKAIRPFYCLLFGRYVIGLVYKPWGEAGSYNSEALFLASPVIVLAVYLAALGLAHVAAAGVLALLVSSSQIAHRLLFRMLFRVEKRGWSDKLAWLFRRAPLCASALCVCLAHCSCGAAALVAGAAIYGIILSNKYEEYLEDYFYKIMAKVAVRVRRLFKSKQNTKQQSSEEKSNSTEVVKAIESDNEPKNETKDILLNDSNLDSTNNTSLRYRGKEKPVSELSDVTDVIKTKQISEQSDETVKTNDKEVIKSSDKSESSDENNSSDKISVETNKCVGENTDTETKGKCLEDLDEELHNINFHMSMFLLWLLVAGWNVMALLAWARDFKYNKVLSPDSSYISGLVLSLCSGIIWDMEGPSRNLNNYYAVQATILLLATVMMFYSFYSMYIINYGTTLVFLLITVQQIFDRRNDEFSDTSEVSSNIPRNSKKECETNENKSSRGEKHKSEDSQDKSSANECGDETNIFQEFKNVQEKIGLND